MFFRTSFVSRFSIRSFIGGLLCVLISCFSFSSASAATGVPHFFNYQGHLLTAAGANVPDGNYDMVFSLYSAAAGGVPLYTSAGTTGTPAPISVNVTNGLFSVLIGDTNFQNQNAMDIDFNQDALYLGVTIGTDGEMTPRKRLSSVPYALNAEKLQGNAASGTVANTGGNLFSLHQASADAASAHRAALRIQTDGTSNQNDFLLIGSNGVSDVFTMSRAGHVTTTGNLVVQGSTALGDVSVAGSLSLPANAITDAFASNSLTIDASGHVSAAAIDSGTLGNASVSLNLGAFGSVVGVLSDGNVANDLIISGGTVNNTPIGALTPSTGVFTNATSTNFAFTSASGSSLLLAGQGVCLANGLNCPTGASILVDSVNTNLVLLTTSTRDFVIGAATTATAPFYFDVGSPSSSLQIGRVGNADLLVGTSTYGGGLSSVFSLNGQDVFVQGKVGALGGMISPLYLASAGDDGAVQAKGFLFSLPTGVTSTGMIANDSGTTVILKAGGANIANFAQSGITLWNNVLLNSDLDTGPIHPHTTISGLYDIGTAQFSYKDVYASGTIWGGTVTTTELNVGQKGINVYSSESDSSAGFFSNSASNTAPVLEVLGGCDDANSSTNSALILAGNYTDHNKFRVGCNGTVAIDGSYNTGGADFAEYFHVNVPNSVTPGDVVTLVPGSTSTVERSSAVRRDATVGVISTFPGFIGNSIKNIQNDPSYRTVGLLGQLPTHASNVNGAIKAGDRVMAGDEGYAVKATGVGLILGRAMEDLNATTGTISIFLDPGWSADGLLENATGTTAFASQGTADVTTSTYDSFSLTFRGSAWNASAGLANDSGFRLFNNVLGASSSRFTIANEIGTSLLTISNIGDVEVTKDLLLGGRLFLGLRSGQVSDKYLFVDDSQSPTSTYIATNADGWETNSTYDYAERFPSREVLYPGDVVTVDAAATDHVRRATSPTDPVLGIVSTKPGFITGGAVVGTFPIALAGRVPTRVSNAQGTIQPGDQLAPSNVPGVAVKATVSGPTIGIALESFADSGEGRISVFVQPGWKYVDQSVRALGVPTPSPEISLARAGLAKIYAGSTQVNISFVSINAYPLISVTPYGQTTKGWWVTNVTDHGFTIVVGEAPMFDLVFAWKVDPSKGGESISFSDGTAASYDPTTGLPSGSPASLPNPLSSNDEASSTGVSATSSSSGEDVTSTSQEASSTVGS